MAPTAPNLDDGARELVNAWLGAKAAWESTHPGCALRITCIYRSPEEQVLLYQQGRRQIADGSWVPDEDPATQIVTQLDGIVKKSKHNIRPARALDFAVILHGKLSWRMQDYLEVGRFAQARGLIWGGTWGQPVEAVWERIRAKKFVDGPHVELPG